MKIYQVLIFSFLFFQSAIGQKPSVKWGQPFDLDKEESFVKVIESDENYHYLQTINLKVIKFGIVNTDNPTLDTPGLIKLDKDFKVVKKNSFKELTDKKRFLGIELLGENFALITEKNNREDKVLEYYIALINKDLEIIKGNTLLWSIPKEKSSTEVTFSFSQDHSIMILKCAYYNLKKDENQKYRFMVLDAELKTSLQKDLTFPQMSEDLSILQSMVTNSGDVYLMTTVSTGNDKKDKTLREFDLFANHYTASGKSSEIKIPISPDKSPLNVYAASSGESNDIYVFAQYTSLEYNGITGYLVSLIDGESNEIVFNQTNNFDLKLIERANDINYDKTKSKDPGLSASYRFSYLKFNQDNSMYVVMEKYYVEGNAIQNSPYRTYHAQNLVAMSIDEKGKQKWANLIPKIQFYNSMTTYLNFFAKPNSDKLFIFYNENEKNIDNSLSISEAPKKFNDLKDFYQMMVEINSNGTMKKSVFLNPEQTPYAYIVKEYVSIGSKQFLMIGKGFKGNSLVVGTGTFD
jgi:hypothetical protein